MRAMTSAMRIFVKPSDSSDLTANVAQEAFHALRRSGIVSARIGGFINDHGVVLVDSREVAFALTMLTRAGFIATLSFVSDSAG
jgi:hypothetical protein